ncbi:L-histidine N(alpha)-methyltransferase [Janibacter limosus]|nr:L-histidine N(alpha)-methyltransferase [Janibacter limosus]
MAGRPRMRRWTSAARCSPETAEQLQSEYPTLAVEPAVADFHHLPPLAGADGERLLLFLGGTIGNFTEDERAGFLRMVLRSPGPGRPLPPRCGSRQGRRRAGGRL